MAIEKLNMETKDLSQEHIKQIQQLFPNAVTEINNNGKITLGIDFDVLKQELSSELIDEKQERYQMTWPDKKKAMLLANSKINASLRPLKEKSVDFDNTKNIYIEGDNLDVLKLLRETYLNKVKMIYIDPPYNTGNDFVYNDDFAQSTDEYNANSGQYDEQGNRMVLNNESNGRFHTDWLNMIYPRLKIARDLLKDDGVIFISIDDNEVDNLSKICSDIFGEINFICKFIWKSKQGKVGTTSMISATHEYILCYSKSVKDVHFKMIKNISEGRKESLRQWGVADRREDRPSMYYPITIDGVTVYPIKEDGTDGRWRVGEEMAKQLLAEGYLELGEKNGKYNIYRTFPSSISYTSYDTLLLDDIGTTAKGATMLKSLELTKTFDFSKPVELIQHFIMLATNDNDIVMDFFSGSSTTAHSVIQLNSIDGGHRKFILVQLPELTNNKEYSTICDIGEERIRRAGKKIKEELIEKKNNAGMLNDDITDPDSLDIGFRVFKLDSSNMNDVYYNPNQTQKNLLETTIDNIKLDRTGLDLLFQVMLELGVELSAKIEEKDILGKKCYFVNDNDIAACFDDDLTNELLTELAKTKPLYAVFKDSCFNNDSVAINNEQIFKTYSPSTKVKVL